MDRSEGLHWETLLQHESSEDLPQGAIIPPLYQNSLFSFERFEELLEAMGEAPDGPPYHYSRFGNPTLHEAERKLAMLEKTECAKLVSTGMGAIGLSVMSAVKTGSHILADTTTYPPVRQFFGEYLKRFGVEVSFADGRDTATFLQAIRPETSLIFLESPSSNIFRLQDLAAIASEAKTRGITTIVDNTYCTPLYQNPSEFGVDIVVHSATKYLSGHYDLMAGAICTTETRMKTIVREELNYFGGILSPFSAWLLLRGMRTLPLRVAAHQTAANRLAETLQEEAWVETVHHLGLPSHPQHELFERQMRGSGGLFSFEPTFQSQEAISAFCSRLRLFKMGLSWGGFKSLVLPVKVENKTLIRLFCGLEETSDLIEDVLGAGRSVLETLGELA